MKRKIILSFVLSAIAMSINAQEYNMKVNKVNGEVLTVATSEIKDVVFEEIKGKEEEPQDEPRFITMGGKKWAMGNLVYDNGKWRIAANQWEYFNAVYGRAGEGNTKCNLSDTQVDHFRWGVLGNAAITQGSDVVKAFGNGAWDIYNISGKMYKDIDCKDETKNFDEAKYGDLAFWATKGKWRMPSKADWNFLKDGCDWQLGYITLDNGKQLYGCLITEAAGDFGETNTIAKEFSKAEVEKNLFLPLAGYRFENKIKNAAYGGYYWTSQLFNKTDNYAFEVSFDRDGFYINQNGGDANNGNCIRPILVETK